MGDGGGGGRPGQPRPEHRARCWARCCGSTSTAGPRPAHYRIPSSNPYVGRTGRDEIWQTRPAQPVAVLVRPHDRDRCGSATSARARTRRSTGPSTRPPAPAAAYNWGWRVMEGRHCHIPSSGCNTTGKVLPITRVHPGVERPVRRDRRLRVPRVADPGARRLVRVRRLLQRRDLGDQGRLVVPAAADHARRRRAAGGGSAASARARPASCSSSTWAARSRSSNPPPDAGKGVPARRRASLGCRSWPATSRWPGSSADACARSRGTRRRPRIACGPRGLRPKEPAATPAAAESLEPDDGVPIREQLGSAPRPALDGHVLSHRPGELALGRRAAHRTGPRPWRRRRLPPRVGIAEHERRDVGGRGRPGRDPPRPVAGRDEQPLDARDGTDERPAVERERPRARPQATRRRASAIAGTYRAPRSRSRAS